MRGAAIEFLEHYARDAQRRWSPSDLPAQEEFVRSVTGQSRWADWSSEDAALRILQANVLPHSFGPVGPCEAILLAGPIAELLEPAQLMRSAVEHLQSSGRIIGILPCLRDNSPESQLFIQLAAATLWPYHTAEELSEIIREAGLNLDPALSQFVPIPRFNEAVLKDELGFKGFRQVFQQLEAEGYDPREVGWGELRFVAAL